MSETGSAKQVAEIVSRVETLKSVLGDLRIAVSGVIERTDPVCVPCTKNSEPMMEPPKEPKSWMSTELDGFINEIKIQTVRLRECISRLEI